MTIEEVSKLFSEPALARELLMVAYNPRTKTVKGKYMSWTGDGFVKKINGKKNGKKKGINSLTKLLQSGGPPRPIRRNGPQQWSALADHQYHGSYIP